MSMNPETSGTEPTAPGSAEAQGSPVSGTSVRPGPEPTAPLPLAGPVPSFGSTPPTPGPAPATAGPIPPTSGRDASSDWGGWLWGGSSARDARRAERRAQREARRAERGIGSAIWGVVLVVIGAGILASELIPGFDWNVAWPATLVAFGVLLIAASIRRAPAGP
jgi:hypothetical protein